MDSIKIQSDDGKDLSVSLNSSECWRSTKPNGRDVIRLLDGRWISRSPGSSNGMVITGSQAEGLLMANGHQVPPELRSRTVHRADLDIRSVCGAGFQ